MGARDSGWVQIYSENNQEAYDNFVQAYRIAEHQKVKLPIMICQDGFITSHGVENIELLEDASVKKFVGEYNPEHFLLNKEEVMAVGPYAVTSYGMESKKAQANAMEEAKKVILDIAEEYEQISGRSYGFFEEYELADAEYAIVVIGSACGTIKDAIDELRAEGLKVGLLKVRVFRPFPGSEMAEALKDVKVIAIMDRCESFSANGGPLSAELSAALFAAKSQAEVQKLVYGLNGRDLKVDDVKQIYSGLVEIGKNGNKDSFGYHYIGLRE